MQACLPDTVPQDVLAEHQKYPRSLSGLQRVGHLLQLRLPPTVKSQCWLCDITAFSVATAYEVTNKGLSLCCRIKGTKKPVCQEDGFYFK